MTRLPQSIWLASVDSTNRALADMVARDPGLADWTTIAAEEQTAGRGRLDHRWISPRGRNIACSILVRADVPPERLATLPLLVGLAVVRAVAKTDSATGSGLSIKWPNDVWYGDRKLCGILCEIPPEKTGADPDSQSRETGTGPVFSGVTAIVGIGVNVNLQAEEIPGPVRQTATSLALASGREWDLRLLLEDLRAELYALCAEWKKRGLSPFLAELRKRDMLLGREFSVEAGNAVERGTGAGIADDGSLLLRNESGEIVSVFAGDIHVAGIS